MTCERTKWFEQARFGMFIHWGLYSVMGRGEWAFNRERWPLEEYSRLAGQFTAEDYDPREWAALARDSGMKYMVLTTKHHEGFCLWDSKLCAFNATRSAARRDLLAEYVDAVREAGLKVGFYYSLGDWFNPDWSLGWKGDECAQERFMEYTHALVRELMTGYGRVDILWYDLAQNYGPAQWRSVDLSYMARQLQPDILINNRALTTEDFATPEQHVHASKPGRMWESCMTLNRNWGHCATDHDWKTPREVVITLANAASGAGNLLLNVGPDGQGKIPHQSAHILRRVGQWLQTHGESIYGSQRHNLSFNLWGPTTVRGNAMYLHLSNYFGPEIIIGGLSNRVLSAALLTTGQKLQVTKRATQTVLKDLPAHSPDELVSVVKLELDGMPDQDTSRVIGGADIFPDLP